MLIPIAMGVLYPAFGITAQPGPRRGGDGAVLGQRGGELAPAPVRSTSARAQAAPLRRGPLGVVRDAAFLVGIALIGLATAGGVLAADRAIDANLPRIEAVAHNVRFEPDRWTVTAGQWTLLEFRNDDPVIHDWMVEGIPNLEVIARPGETETVRFVLDRPGEYECCARGWSGRVSRAYAGRPGMVGPRPALVAPQPVDSSRVTDARSDPIDVPAPARARIAVPEDPRDLPGDFPHRFEVDDPVRRHRRHGPHQQLALPDVLRVGADRLLGGRHRRAVRGWSPTAPRSR